MFVIDAGLSPLIIINKAIFTVLHISADIVTVNAEIILLKDKCSYLEMVIDKITGTPASAPFQVQT